MMTWEDLDALEKEVAAVKRDLNLAENAHRRAVYDANKLEAKVHAWKDKHPGNPKHQDPPEEPPPEDEEPPPEEEDEIPPPAEEDEIPPDETDDEDTGEIEPAEPNPDPARGLLAEDWLYQKQLVDWLATITEEDVAIPQEPPIWDGTYEDIDELAELWVELGTNQTSNEMWSKTGSKFPSQDKILVLKTRPYFFTLQGIQHEGQLHLSQFPTTPAYWYQRAYGGNVFYKNTGVAKRALVVVAVDMIQTDYWHDHKQELPEEWGQSANASDSSRFLGGCMTSWTYAYLKCHEVLTEEERQPFINGFYRMMSKLIASGPGRSSPNMSTRVIPAMANVYLSIPELQDMALRIARKYMFGYEDGVYKTHHKFPNCLAYPAGYTQEGFGPETTYNGVSLYHYAEARAETLGISEWDEILDEFLCDNLNFRAHQQWTEWQRLNERGEPIEPRPFPLGPSAYAGRTGGGYESLQAGHSWRDITLASIYEEGRPFANQMISPTKGPNDEERMLSRLNATFKDGGKFQLQFSEIDTLDAPVYMIDHAHHWPSHTPYHAEKGWYEPLLGLWAVQDESVKLPFDRPEPFSKDFDGEFWAYRGDGFGFFVEHLDDSGTYDAYRGGSLQGFWKEETGIVIIGRKDKSSGDFLEVETWAAHHVFGGGWSSAVEVYRDVEYGEDFVSVGGAMNDEAQLKPNNVDVTNTFTATPVGIEIEHTLSEEVEAWASIPVYLKDSKRQAGIPETTIEYRIGDTWSDLTTDLVEIDEIRLGREGGYAYITPTQTAKAKLSPEPWQQSYQGNSLIRNIHIEIIGNLTYEVH